ncbi:MULTISPECIES: exodeoxyribonuclease VII small subunit [unclassified Pyramidobacter]|nr:MULTISPECIES: exodeoxyribonuclease VII small subunit [unclassified Pyramidobacter]MCI7403203.1 exodeoxyribonuclease VII small subunit [Pyramidobacter sp.]MDY3212107.1 exodeoxyribonuclease VII small subunit [Pyramidobacter sp.]OON87542.1 exodeoxyribonuclease VII small subunit [Pyramidobacter sp. C12-8]WOL41285.1 exodeoxyribonuclease VII small subunit [Pyramidobacter sp. YE332]
MDYSAKIGRLEEILKNMERTAMPLEQTLALYEEGQKLVAECRRFLAEAEGKVKKLEDDGTLSDFDRQEEDENGL